MQHTPSSGESWTRWYDYEWDETANKPKSNRLVGASLPGDLEDEFSAQYTHDAQGNLSAMPHLSEMEWDWAQRLVHVDKNGAGQDVYFAYDSGGNRVRKVYVHSGYEEERIYLGEYEVYRKPRRSPKSGHRRSLQNRPMS